MAVKKKKTAKKAKKAVSSRKVDGAVVKSDPAVAALKKRTKWDESLIKKRILALADREIDLTCANIKLVDSALLGAAVSYFGSWKSAVLASGLDYDEIKKASTMKREEKIRKWSQDKVVEEIRRIALLEEDLSYQFIKEKHPPLAAAASKYMGSWKDAIEKAGLDYSDVMATGRRKRHNLKKEWRDSLLLERLDIIGVLNENIVREKQPKFHRMLIDYFGDWRSVVKALKLKRERNDGKET
ncbi:MAG TPA: hypothetical protein PLQ76_03705 [bacterium]|nr:hypothetical protein [bacterium]